MNRKVDELKAGLKVLRKEKSYTTQNRNLVSQPEA
jgi:hypothetical protein